MENTPSKPHDRYVKDLLSHHDAAVAFLQQALPQNIAALLDIQMLQHTHASYTTQELQEYISDIVLRVPILDSNNEAEVTVLIEHKSYKDRKLPFQLLSYVAAGYQQQLKNGKTLHVIIPIVYYHGKQKWDIPALADYFPSVPEAILKYVPQWSFEMLSIRNMTPDQIQNITNTMLKAAMIIQKGAHKRIFALEEYARVFNTLHAENEGNFFISTMVYIFETEVFQESELSIITKELNNDMRTKTLTIKEALIARGMEKGRQEGREEGRREGRQEGSIQSRYEFAGKLIQRNMPINEICDLTNLTYEEIQTLIEKGK
jgi:predicted transposase/invertase (TIGR01784 family)